jgi:hypothetical protein
MRPCSLADRFGSFLPQSYPHDSFWIKINAKYVSAAPPDRFRSYEESRPFVRKIKGSSPLEKGSALAPPAYIPTAEAGGFTPGFGKKKKYILPTCA